MNAKTVWLLGTRPAGTAWQRLYQLSEPHAYNAVTNSACSYVVVSEIPADGLLCLGTETLLFAAGSDGEIIDWRELAGTWHTQAGASELLAEIGYRLVEVE